MNDLDLKYFFLIFEYYGWTLEEVKRTSGCCWTIC